MGIEKIIIVRAAYLVRWVVTR